MRNSDDIYLRRDLLHSLSVALLAVLLSGGLLWLRYLGRVWRIARDSSQQAPDAAYVLVFGKRLRRGHTDADYRRRLAQAHSLLHEQPTRPVILLGGGPSGQTEAEAGMRELQRLGLPEHAEIWLEQASRDTLQNLRNARALLAGRAPGRVVLLSNRYHLPRCIALARQLGFDCELCAAEPRFRLLEQGVSRLLLESAYVCWFEVGTRWARLIRHQRMLRRIT